MTESHPILHHYASSPFAEKVRLALGLKGLAWSSVEIPNMPPRPRLDPLTGGYRRVPVMQIGADIFCDTGAILPALERLAPEPTLYPGPAAGLAKALAFNFERTVWLAAIGVRVHFGRDAPEDFLRDRREDYLYVDISRAAMAPRFAHDAQFVAAQVAFLAETLGDGRAFLGGDRPGALDLAFFHPLWLIRSAGGEAESAALIGAGAVAPWYGRVAALGHGRPSAMDAEAAIQAARAAEPMSVEAIPAHACPPGVEPGVRVRVTPDDFARRPVEGVLVSAGPDAAILRRDDPAVGTLHLHFPRAGFALEAA